MDTLDSLIQKVNSKGTPIFFVTNDAERALGLERLLANYYIICIDNNDIVDYLSKEKINVFCLEKELGAQNVIFRNSNRLLNHELTRKYISQKANAGASLMFFKIAPNLERTAEKLGFSILNTSSKLNRKFELKFSQYRALMNLNIRLPKTQILKLKDTDYNYLVKEFREGFVIQFKRGHTGGGTIRINSMPQFDELKELFPEREVKVSTFIEGPAYTLNACVTKHGVAWGGLSYQITGVEECTSKKSATVGNDWEFPKFLSKEAKDEIDKFTKEIGSEMQRHGFKGMFGLDIVVDKENKAFVIEINARQPASIPMFTKLQLEKKQIPLSLLAIAEFLGIDYNIDIEKYNSEATLPFSAAQIFLRNKFENQAKVVGGVKVGAYRLVGENLAYDWSQGDPKRKPNVIILDEKGEMPLTFQQEAYAIDGISGGGLLILCTKEGKIVNPNSEVARIQTRQSMLEDKGELKTWVCEILKGLNKYIVLKEVKK